MRCLRCYFVLFTALLLWITMPMIGKAADSSPVLTARETGVPLYARQDPETDRIATLEKNELLFPIAESVGNEIWYMVRTQHGLTGWVRAVDVVVSNEARATFRERDSASSTWSARTSAGRTYSGTWSVAPDSTSDRAGGAWTLSGANGATMMRGTWSADRHSTGWNGVWHARVEGRDDQYSGSWSAEFSYVRSAPFADLFAAAAKQAISGLWTGASESGSWSIHATN